MKTNSDAYSAGETAERFGKILRGAMHKPTQLKDIPKTRKRKAKPSASPASRASAKTAKP